MGGFRDFLTIPFPEIDLSEQLNAELSRLKTIEMFSSVTPQDLPIKVGVGQYSLKKIFSDLFTINISVERIRAEKAAKLIFTASDELVSFEKATIAELDISKLDGFLNSLGNSNTDYLEQLQLLILPFLLRVPIEQLNNESLGRILNTLKKFNRKSIFIQALNIRTTIFHLEKQISLDATISTCLKTITTSLHKIYDSNYCDSIIPIICNMLVPQIFKACREVFGRENINLIEKIECQVYLPVILGSIAAYYPLALRNTEWAKLCEYFAQNSDFKRQVYPGHDFFINYPEKVQSNMVAENIIALMFSFAYFYKLSPNNPENDLYISCLRAICTKNQVGQHAVARSLYTMTKFSKFKPKVDLFLKIIKKDDNAAILYINMMRDNYTETPIKLEQNLNLGEILSEKFAGSNNVLLRKSIKQICCMTKPNFSSQADIVSITRSLECILGKSIYEVYCIAKSENLYSFLDQYIINLLKNGTIFKDFRTIPVICHLCTCYLTLFAKTVAKSQNVSLGFDAKLVLMIYDTIAVTSEPIITEAKSYTSLSASNYVERMKIASLIKGIRTQFFHYAILLCTYEFPSLRFALLLLLYDTLDYSIDSSLDQFTDIFDKIIPWNLKLFKSESPYISSLGCDLLIKLVNHTPVGKCNFISIDLFTSVDKAFKSFIKTPDKERKLLRIFSNLTRLFSCPNVKTSFLHEKDINKFIVICYSILSTSIMMEHQELAHFSFDILSVLCSYEITIIPHAPAKFRKIYDTVDADNYLPIVKKIGKIIEGFANVSPLILIHALKMMLFICQSEFFVDVFMKMNFSIDLEAIAKNEKFQETFMQISSLAIQITTELAEFDTSYAKRFIKFEKIESKLTNFPEGVALKQKLDSGDRKLVLEFQLKELQEFPKFRKTVESHKMAIAAAPKFRPLNGAPMVLRMINPRDDFYLGEVHFAARTEEQTVIE
ncbi:hypothetical protein TVAG_056090 [Trichomonas vaginalis G3]|uniref:Uncharacterized protein n=1 Tax=Trichomonas vaginalis (strain ATCC PRA-98 / G3) TaxID=412133 RepID=A2EL62_TRIV3|nr:hypothetical protein TVAGG3_0217370 [Trichomonas vaginalis G3]EAY06615.1 hypothetical protein TVAG_056090 [Trichomonas vaginalis G3]KAI5551657.1 hypothetical protein TVAGG3_0217370 [Trichomonas vaginalis G3]|eukprot:XP_001318838.1 hypothetical protein [Trichomonas vaginalis G3]